MPEDEEDLRIQLLRQELMREVDSIKGGIDSDHNDLDKRLESVETYVKIIGWGIGILVGLFALIAGILANAANLI